MKNETMMVSVKCPFCGKRSEIEVPVWGYLEWECGMSLIQHAMPELSASEREVLVSGACIDCQKKIFGEETA